MRRSTDIGINIFQEIQAPLRRGLVMSDQKSGVLANKLEKNFTYISEEIA